MLPNPALVPWVLDASVERVGDGICLAIYPSIFDYIIIYRYIYLSVEILIYLLIYLY